MSPGWFAMSSLSESAQVGNPVRLAHKVRAEVDPVSECKGMVKENVDCEVEASQCPRSPSLVSLGFMVSI